MPLGAGAGRSGRGADSTSLSAAPRWMAPSKPDGMAGAFALGMGGGGGFFFGGDGCAAVFGIGGGGGFFRGMGGGGGFLRAICGWTGDAALSSSLSSSTEGSRPSADIFAATACLGTPIRSMRAKRA